MKKNTIKKVAKILTKIRNSFFTYIEKRSCYWADSPQLMHNCFYNAITCNVRLYNLNETKISAGILLRSLIIIVLLFSFLLEIKSQNHKRQTTVVWQGDKVLTQDTVVQSLDTLKIIDGAFIDFQTFELKIYGTLLVKGKVIRAVTLTSSKNDGWKGIRFYGSQASRIEYCRIENINPGTLIRDNCKRNIGGLLINESDNLIIQNSIFVNNKGGIVLSNSSNVLIKNNLLKNNVITGDEVGLIYLSSGSYALIRSNTFDNNTVNKDGIISVNYGSKAFITHGNSVCNTKYNTLVTNPPWEFSAIVSKNSIYLENKLIIADNSFFNNEYQDIVLWNDPDNLTNSLTQIFNNTFEGGANSIGKNTAIKALGAKLLIDGCNIKDYNYCSIILNYSEVNIKNNVFLHNESDVIKGGAIRFNNYENYNGEEIVNRIESNKFSDNKAVDGGAIYAEIPSNSCYLEIESNIFLSNVSPGSEKNRLIGMGGAISITNTVYSDIMSNVFEQNESNSSGGAISLSNVENIHIVNNLFFRNKTNSDTGDGGAIYINGDEEVFGSYDITFNDFFFNESKNNGGALYASSNGQLSGPAFFFGVNINDFFFNNSGNSGAAIYTGKGKIKLIQNKIGYNKAYNGGGIYCDTVFSGKVFSNIIYADTAIESGGGIYVNSSDIEIYDNIIQGNSYNILGGGIFLENSDEVLIKRNLICNMHNPSFVTNASGGGVYVKNSSVSFLNSIFNNNEAEDFKGALTLELEEENEILIHNCDFINNFESGGVYFNGPSFDPDLVSIHNNIFYGNWNKSIINQYSNPEISTHFNWFDILPGGYTGNIVNLNPVLGLSPEFISINDFNLLPTSSCIDTGNADISFNDVNFPPSQDSARNDIGATGGPYTRASSPVYQMINLHTSDAQFVITEIEDHTITIKDLSNVGNADQIKYRWYFGDGSSVINSYENQPAVFERTYEENTENVIITLILETSNDYSFHWQEVNFENSRSGKVSGTISNNDLKESGIETRQNGDFLGKNINIFPNPSCTGFFNIDFAGLFKGEIRIRIFSQSGQTIYQEHWTRKNKGIVNISNMQSGIYFLEADDGFYRCVKKIIVNK